MLWTDGSSFSTVGFGHRPWIIRKPEEYQPNCIYEIFNQGRQSKMVWSGFCGSVNKSDLVLIPGKAELDSAAYVTTVMEPHLVPLWHRRCEEYGWAIVVKDGAPRHKGHSKNH